MANTIKKAERAQIMAFARKLIEAGTPAPVDALITQTGISRERARLAIAHTEAIMRGEEVKRTGRPTISSDGAAMVMFSIRVPEDLGRFLDRKGDDRVREKLTEWMNEAG